MKYEISGNEQTEDKQVKETDWQNQPAPKNKRWPIIAAAAAGAAAIAIVAFIAVTNRPGESNPETSTRLVYLKDNAVIMADLSNKKAKPVTLTDSFETPEAPINMFWRHCFSDDGTYVYYMENCNGTDYDLYRAMVSNPARKEKISSAVTDHTAMKDDTCIYIKNDSLHYFNGKDTLKFGNNVRSLYYCDKDQKNICWYEYEGAVRTFYLQDLAQQNEKIELMTDVKSIYRNEAMTQFHVLANSTIYSIDITGNKDPIAHDVARIVSINSETEEIYYARDAVKEISSIDINYEELYYYDGKTEHFIDDMIPKGECWYNRGQFIIYQQLPPLENLNITSPDLNDNDITALLSANNIQANTVLVLQGQKTGTYENISYAGALMDYTNMLLYLYSEDTAQAQGTIYTIALKGDQAGELIEYDTDAYPARLCQVSDEGLYYLKNSDHKSGDLYLNDKLLLTDVSQIWGFNENKELLLATGLNGETCDLSLQTSAGTTPIISNAKEINCTVDGTIVILSNYNSREETGDLYYYDGKELRLIDNKVSDFSIRRYTILPFLYN